jgi:hypothetical protein
VLAALCDEHAVPYVRTAGLALSYLDDDLHLTAASHVVFGDAVAAGIASVSARPAATGR